MALNTAFADDAEDEAPQATAPAPPRAALSPTQPTGVLSVASPTPAPGGGPGGVLGVIGSGVADLAKLPFGILSEMGANVQTRIAEDHFVQQQRQAMLNAMGQHLAAIHDMGQALLTKSDRDNYNLLMADPDGYIKTEIGNRAYLLAKGGDSLLNSQGVGPTAPLMSVQDGTPITQMPGQTTVTGPRLPGTITAGNGVFTDSHAGPVGTYSQPTIVPAGGNLVGAPTTVSTLDGRYAGVPSFGVPTSGPAPTDGSAGVTGPGAPPITWGLKALGPQARSFAGRVLAHPAIAALAPSDRANILGIGFSESRLDPAVGNNGSSTGGFQFQPATFKQFMPNGDINNPDDQIAAEAKMYGADKAALGKTLGRDPTGAELYLAAMQGPTGASALLTAQSGVNAVTALRQAGVSSAKALASIAGNIPGMDYHTAAGRQAANSAAMKMTAQQFVSTWGNHFNANLAHMFGGGSPDGSGTATRSVSGQSVPPPPPAPGAGSLIAQGRQSRLLTAQESQARGAPPGTILQQAPDGTYSAAVTRDKAGLPADDQARLNQIKEKALKMSQLAALGEQFVGLNSKQGTGGFHAIPGELDVEAAFNPTITNMNSLTKEMIPLQRDVGAGPIRVGEIAGPGGGIWGGDVPRAQAPREANEFTARNWRQTADQLQAYSTFADQWAQTHATLNGMDAAWAKQNGGTLYRTAPNGSRNAPVHLSPKNADAEYQALPKGAHYVGPDGKVRVK